MTPHEILIPGPAADFAATLASHLPQIETDRLRLRAPRLQDFDAWAEIFSGPAAVHIGGPFSRGDAFMEFATTVGTWLLRGHGLWAVDHRDGTLLGFVLIGFEPGDLEPELGYLFLPAAEGHGYATEAAAAARDHALENLKLPSLVSYIAPANRASARVATRLGARRDRPHDGSDVWRHAPTPLSRSAL